MNNSSRNKLVYFICSIVDVCLKDLYVRGKYRDVILPVIALRRLDAILEQTKDVVLEELVFQRDAAKVTEWDEIVLREASGFVFYKVSKWPLQKLKETVYQKIETAKSLKQQEIAALKECKSSLINSVVIGKVKVC
jgi:type I restriction enzyme M protein